jgi:hypothetical protein
MRGCKRHVDKEKEKKCGCEGRTSIKPERYLDQIGICPDDSNRVIILIMRKQCIEERSCVRGLSSITCWTLALACEAG